MVSDWPMSMNEEKWKRRLEEEGFTNIFVWHDEPNFFHSDHTHDVYTAHIVLEGEMTVVSEEKTKVVKEGGRFDVPAHTIHSAKAGPKGCTYIIGEK